MKTRKEQAQKDEKNGTKNNGKKWKKRRISKYVTPRLQLYHLCFFCKLERKIFCGPEE